MPLTSDGYFDWAQREPGFIDKVYSQTNANVGFVPHSMEGSYAGAKSRLFSTEREADGRYTEYAAASWGASNLKDGRFIQHYSVYRSTWTSGARYPNTHFFAVENEGKVGEPLTEAQTDNLVRCIFELSGKFGWTPERPTHPRDIGATLYEHNEMVRFGADPTACPSGRIPWDEIMGALMVTKEEFAELFKYVQRVDAAVKFLIDVSLNLAGEVYEGDQSRIDELEEKVKALEK